MPLPDLPGGLAAAQAFEAEQAILRAGFGLPPVRSGALKIEHFQDYKVKPFENIELTFKYNTLKEKQLPEWIKQIRSNQKEPVACFQSKQDSSKDVIEEMTKLFITKMRELENEKQVWCTGKDYKNAPTINKSFFDYLIGQQKIGLSSINGKVKQKTIFESYECFTDLFARRCACVCWNTLNEICGFALYHFMPVMDFKEEIMKSNYDALFKESGDTFDWTIHIDVVVANGCGTRIMENIALVAACTGTPEVELDSLQSIKFDSNFFHKKLGQDYNKSKVCKQIDTEFKENPYGNVQGITFSLNKFYYKLGYRYADSHMRDSTQRMRNTFPSTIVSAFKNTLSHGILRQPPVSQPPEQSSEEQPPEKPPGQQQEQPPGQPPGQPQEQPPKTPDTPQEADSHLERTGSPLVDKPYEEQTAGSRFTGWKNSEQPEGEQSVNDGDRSEATGSFQPRDHAENEDSQGGGIGSNY
jgi:hypothetical protein